MFFFLNKYRLLDYARSDKKINARSEENAGAALITVISTGVSAANGMEKSINVFFHKHV